MLCHVVVACLCAVYHVFAVNPGMRIRVTQDGINYANKHAVDSFVTGIRNTRLEDAKGTFHGLQYEFTNLIVEDFKIPKSSITLASESDLNWFAGDINLDVEGLFRYKFLAISDSGGIRAKASDASFKIGMDIGIDADGKPMIKTKSCKCIIGSLSIKIKMKSKRSWIYNTLISFARRAIASMLEKRFCERALIVIDHDAEKELCAMKMKVELGEYLTLDYRLIKPPFVTAQYIEADLLGEVYWTANRTAAPFLPAAMATITDNKKMVYVTLSDYLFNTMMYQAHVHGLLVFNLASNNVRGIGDLLNTTCEDTCIGKIIPQIGQQFPYSKVEILMTSTVAPNITINEKYLYTRGASNVTFVARSSNNTQYFLFSIHANIEAYLKLKMTSVSLNGKVDAMRILTNVTKSNIGTIDKDEFQGLVDDVVKKVITPLINNLLEFYEIPIPVTDNLEFKGSSVKLLQNTILVESDVKIIHNDWQKDKLRSTILRYIPARTAHRPFPSPHSA